MFLKKYLPYFCVLLCHKYALTFIKLQGKNGKRGDGKNEPGQLGSKHSQAAS